MNRKLFGIFPLAPIDFYTLTIKYYLQGDSWEEAKVFAKRIVYGFKKE